MPLVPGTIDVNGEFVETDSLARSIDNELTYLPDFSKVQRRQFLVAIATGLIKYLKAHDADGSFTVRVTISGTTYTGTFEIS